MSTGLKFAPVDDDRADLLTELAEDRITQAAVLVDHETTDPEWTAFVEALHQVIGENHGRVSPNHMRPLLKAADVPARRVGPFYRRACKEGLIYLLPAAHWDVSDDTKGGNAGKPARTYADPTLMPPAYTYTEEHSA